MDVAHCKGLGYNFWYLKVETRTGGGGEKECLARSSALGVMELGGKEDPEFLLRYKHMNNLCHLCISAL